MAPLATKLIVVKISRRVIWRILFLRQNVFQGVVNDFAVFPAAHLVAAGHHGQSAQTGDGDVAFVSARSKRSVRMLILGEESQARVDSLLAVRGNHVLGGAAVGHLVTNVGLDATGGRG